MHYREDIDNQVVLVSGILEGELYSMFARTSSYP